MSVSAVLPVYNGSNYVAEAIESIYAQTILPDELIVVDDGSTDDSMHVLKRFEGRPGYRVMEKRHGGVASARNVGVVNSTGEFVAFLDQDDLWKPRKLERQLEHFDADWGMSFTGLEVLTTTDSIPDVEVHETWDPAPAAVLGRLEESCAVGPPSTALIRRDALQRVPPFEEVEPFGADWLMWLRFAKAGHRIGYLPEPLTEYRWHGDNASNDVSASFDAGCAVFDRYGDRRLRARRRLLTAIYAHETNDRKRARRRILEAARIRPLSVRPGWLKLLW